jgi:organic hydroperoxide reductase OsmC/OhrA
VTPVHEFRATCSWTGSTAERHTYDPAHTAAMPPSATELRLSAAAGFRGDAALPDPEQLVLLAASSCQLMAFLAVAARARIDVRRYDDDAYATMPSVERPERITEIVLRPRIVVAAGPAEERVRHLVEVAHRECFVANSLATPMRIEPVVTFEG